MNGGRGVWRFDRAAGIVTLRCAALPEDGPWVHAFSTRRGGGEGPFDLRLPEDGGGEEAARRRTALLAAIGLPGVRLVEVRQVHGAGVVAAREVGPSSWADAVTIAGDDAAVAVGVRTADCVPVLLADPGGTAAAAVHAGWRGIVAGVVPAAVGALSRAGAASAALLAAVGPAIGPCCYRVDPACAAAVVAAAAGPAAAGDEPVEIAGADGPRLSLRAAVVRQLVAAGVAPAGISVAPWCTRCARDLWFSHRGEGPRAGRMLAVLGRRAGPWRP